LLLPKKWSRVIVFRKPGADLRPTSAQRRQKGPLIHSLCPQGRDVRPVLTLTAAANARRRPGSSPDVTITVADADRHVDTR
jgi:hypothetical protein